MPRRDGRAPDELRPLVLTRRYVKYAEGSVLVELGDTRVVCTASVEEKVPPFLRGTGQGWVTAEYGMLPRSTRERSPRDATTGRVGGRVQEIQRLIGRSLRAVVDLERLGERTIWLDCDVIQADGGTRTAAITGAFVAMMDALALLKRTGTLPKIPVREFLAATSVGIVDGVCMLDLTFEEDSRARVDMNIVMTESGKFAEIQGTGEGGPFTKQELSALMALGERGIVTLIARQREVLADLVPVLCRDGLWCCPPGTRPRCGRSRPCTPTCLFGSGLWRSGRTSRTWPRRARATPRTPPPRRARWPRRPDCPPWPTTRGSRSPRSEAPPASARAALGEKGPGTRTGTPTCCGFSRTCRSQRARRGTGRPSRWPPPTGGCASSRGPARVGSPGPRAGPEGLATTPSSSPWGSSGPWPSSRSRRRTASATGPAPCGRRSPTSYASSGSAPAPGPRGPEGRSRLCPGPILSSVARGSGATAVRHHVRRER